VECVSAGEAFWEHWADLRIGVSDLKGNDNGSYSSSIAYSSNCHDCYRISAAQLASNRI
jgi:hypothetical protein